jgi:hypothetical protein
MATWLQLSPYTVTMEDGSFNWEFDTAWTKPMVETSDSIRHKALNGELYNQGLMCRSQGGDYVFIDTSNSWCNLASHEAMSRIVDLAEMKNVSVSQDKAMRSLNKWITKRCSSRVCNPLPVSVCIGTRRYEMDIDADSRTIRFIPCRPLLTDIAPSAHPAVSQVCVMPVEFDVLPVSYTFPGHGAIMNYLMKLFRDDRDAVTYLWHVGNCLMDPVSRPRTVMLVGPGGTGKSTLMSQLMSSLVGCCSIIPNGALTSTKDEMSTEVSDAISSSRMTICVDVDLEKYRLNMSVFKNISGSDYIRIGYNFIKTNCSLTIGTNDLVNIDTEPSYLSDAILRRVVSIHMNVDALTVPPAVPPESSDARLDFVCACIYIRSRYDSMPVRPLTLLLTLCNSKMNEAVEYIEETDEPVTLFQANEVLLILSSILNLPAESIPVKARLVSPYCVCNISGNAFLRGLRPIRM